MITKTATFALGCFWSAEEAYRTQPGVLATAVGHMDRAEVVQVTYDSGQVSYETLLMIFWENHDPTAADPGGLERSELFTHDAEQQAAAGQSKARLEHSGKFRRPIATPISPAVAFTRAPEDQQRYYLKHGIASCNISH